MKDPKTGDRTVDASQLGATGRFPLGKMHADDEGELRLGIASDPEKNLIFVNFGKPVQFLGLEPKNAREIAKALREHARKVEKARSVK